MGRFKVAFIIFLLRHFDFVLVADCPYENGDHDGFVIETLTEEHEGTEVAAVAGIMMSAMENRPYVCKAILRAALEYLKRYEVDCKNFVQELYEKK